MRFVNVVLLAAQDSTLIQGTTTDELGKFNIVTSEVNGILKISSVGYETVYVNLSDYREGNTISMVEDAQMLNEVTVKSQLPKTKLTGNSMVTSIQGSVLEKSGTAKEMLAKVPGMTLRSDELEVIGKGTPVFYINGRKVNDKDELKRMRSEDIKEVEVITNPGAQYDAAVSAVVRIKTLRRQGIGFGFDFDVTNSNDLAYGNDDPSANLNLRYRHNKVDFFAGINYSKWDGVSDSYPEQLSFVKGDNGQIKTVEQLINLLDSNSYNV
ncbi:MAG: hypothetical protein KBT34_05155 [Prevotella sp.]|nr:hypothetical protein [Candidatus Prevotella equi]